MCARSGGSRGPGCGRILAGSGGGEKRILNADVIVVGLGAMGSAAAYQLARRGATVLGIDRFAPPHERGSSHGETRITRQATGEGDEYIPIVMRSHEIWREIEADTGAELFLQCGGLVLSGAQSRHPTKIDFMKKTIGLARRHGIDHELLTAAEIRSRFPQFILEGDERGYFEPGAGLLYSERCITTQLSAAERAGAVLRLNEEVRSVTPAGPGVRLETDAGEYEAGAAIICAGAWTPGLVPQGLEHVTLHRQVLNWYQAETPSDYDPSRFPVFIWLHGSAGEQCYGFPVPPGTTGLKVASEHFASSLGRPEAVRREVEPSETDRTYRDHVAGRLRGVSSHCLRAKTCIYSLAPDGRFIIDGHPDSDRITVVSACSGHGFKHSAAIGEALAQRLLEGRSALDLTPFRWSAAA